MINRTLVSIVIPTYNRRELLGKCLKSIYAQMNDRYEYEIIVVNDGSTDDTEIYLKDLNSTYHNLIYISQENSGHSIARNVGFSRARGKIIISLDDDCMPLDNWLNGILQEFNGNPGVSIICGRILNPTNTKIAWAEYLIDFSLWMSSRRKENIKIIYTANVAYRREVIERYKFQDDGKYFGYRDSIFNYELIKKGYKAVYCPNIKVAHYKWDNDGSGDKRALFIQEQIRRGKGFLADGYKVHGKTGYAFIRLPGIAYIIVKSILILLRSIFSGLLIKYILYFDYILLGLWYQSSAIKKREMG